MLQALKKYKYDILICTSIIAISIIGKLHINYTFYRWGQSNTPSFDFILIGISYEFLKISIVIFSLVRISFGLKNKQKLRRYSVTAIISILIFIGSWILFFNFGQPGAVHFLRGYEKWVANNVEIDKIQNWLISGEADKYMNNTYNRSDFPEELPEYVTNFNPLLIIFQDDSDSGRGKYIKFDCGTGLSYTGIVIGLPTMKTQSDGVIKESESYYEYRLSIKPGIYIYDAG